MSNGKERISRTQRMVLTATMVAITILLMITPIGTIRLPVVSITIANVPAIIAAIVLGLPEGLTVSVAFGLSSLVMAATNPTGSFDPFFVNPLVSILPRALIAVTTYFSYQGLRKLTRRSKSGEYFATVTSIVIGNLTNTFGVYTMLYLVYAQKFFEATGKEALTLIVGALSTSTVFKCIGVVVIVTPIVLALNKVYKKN